MTFSVLMGTHQVVVAQVSVHEPRSVEMRQTDGGERFRASLAEGGSTPNEAAQQQQVVQVEGVGAGLSQRHNAVSR